MTREGDPAVNETDPILPDGIYDVMVIEVEDQITSSGEPSSAMSLVIVTGPLKGQVVTLEQALGPTDPLLLLGTPGRLSVTDQELRLQLES